MDKLTERNTNKTREEVKATLADFMKPEHQEFAVELFKRIENLIQLKPFGYE